MGEMLVYSTPALSTDALFSVLNLPCVLAWSTWQTRASAMSHFQKSAAFLVHRFKRYILLCQNKIFQHYGHAFGTHCWCFWIMDVGVLASPFYFNIILKK